MTSFNLHVLFVENRFSLFIFICRPGNETDVENAVQDLLDGNNAGIISAFNSIDWSEEAVQEFAQGIEDTDIYQACYANIPVRKYTIITSGALLYCLHYVST